MEAAKPQSVPVSTPETVANTVVKKPFATRTVVAPAKKVSPTTVSAIDVWGVLLFLGFLAVVTAVATFIELAS